MASKEYAYIFDIDGTLADCRHRLHFIQEEPKNWEKFFCKEEVQKDKIIPDNTLMFKILNSMAEPDCMLFITGRREETREATANWLCEKVFNGNYKPTKTLYMRKNHDYRLDWMIKEEIYNTRIKDKYKVLGVFEDRTQVVQMWRRLGLTCYQVSDGDY